MNELIRDDDSRDDGDAIEDASYLTERVTTVSYPLPPLPHSLSFLVLTGIRDLPYGIIGLSLK